MRIIDLNEISIKSAIRLMMEGTSYKQFQEIAKELKIPRSTFQSQLDNNSLRVRDLVKVADLLGYQLKLDKKEDEVRE
ncbi:hypothetical protein D1B31_22045 [Neobacillus notoginsengisoli]|uniref:XRE family transcriptional regulator n=1 Tax=Neobacillus notoginsengisoli TaxID=1578198 RepID=A0A417YFF9_9BACI|nr:hypothetical protein [Neobacillus notoginsengisoli]RHW31491.1 hypothetical protein D1B31_22045 [Neobacillus notoginsengisoli]